MKVVIRIRAGAKRPIRADLRPNREVARVVSAAVLPLGLLSFLVCGWRWAFELGWTGAFLVSDGMLSHWQVWFVAGTLAQTVAVGLRRYAGPEGSDAVTDAELLRKQLP